MDRLRITENKTVFSDEQLHELIAHHVRFSLTREPFRNVVARILNEVLDGFVYVGGHHVAVHGTDQHCCLGGDRVLLVVWE